MFEKIFGKKEKMYVMSVYWDCDVDMDYMMADMEILSWLINRPSTSRRGSKITRVGTDKIDDTEYRVAKLYVDKDTENKITKLLKDKEFVAMKFSKTELTKIDKNGKRKVV